MGRGVAVTSATIEMRMAKDGWGVIQPPPIGQRPGFVQGERLRRKVCVPYYKKAKVARQKNEMYGGFVPALANGPPKEQEKK